MKDGVISADHIVIIITAIVIGTLARILTFRITLDNFGQRQATLFEATRAIGVKRYHFTRKEYEKGRIVITLVPIVNDINKLIETVKNTPLLESAKKSHAVMKTNLIGRR